MDRVNKGKSVSMLPPIPRAERLCPFQSMSSQTAARMFSRMPSTLERSNWRIVLLRMSPCSTAPPESGRACVHGSGTAAVVIESRNRFWRKGKSAEEGLLFIAMRLLLLV